LGKAGEGNQEGSTQVSPPFASNVFRDESPAYILVKTAEPLELTGTQANGWRQGIVF